MRNNETLLFTFTHPKHGQYWVFYDADSKCYGIAKESNVKIHCGYATLSALFSSKGF